MIQNRGMPTNKLLHAFRLEEYCCYNKINKKRVLYKT